MFRSLSAMPTFGGIADIDRCSAPDTFQSASRQGQVGTVLFVADVLHPVDDPAIERLRNGYVGHCRRGRGAVPVLLAWCKPHDVARRNVFDRAPRALYPPCA